MTLKDGSEMLITPVEQNNLLDKFEKYLQVLKGLVPSSVRAYRRHVEEFLSWRAGNALDGPATKQDVEGYFEWCFYRGNSNVTRTAKRTALQNYFRYLIYTGLQAEDPTATLPRLRVTRPFMQTFNQEEVLRLFGAIDISSEKGLRDAVFLILGTFTGFRVSEIAGFNIEQVQDDGKDIDLVIPKTKRGAGRNVYLWKAPGMFVRQLLAARIAAGARTGYPLIIGYYKGGRPRGNGRLSTRALETRLKILATRAKIRKPRIKIHMLRATHANDLQHVRGYTLPAIMERMGWKNLETAARYLVHRERIHKEHASLHAYWSGFAKVWTCHGTHEEADGRQNGQQPLE